MLTVASMTDGRPARILLGPSESGLAEMVGKVCGAGPVEFELLIPHRRRGEYVGVAWATHENLPWMVENAEWEVWKDRYSVERGGVWIVARPADGRTDGGAVLARWETPREVWRLDVERNWWDVERDQTTD